MIDVGYSESALRLIVDTEQGLFTTFPSKFAVRTNLEMRSGSNTIHRDYRL